MAKVKYFIYHLLLEQLFLIILSNRIFIEGFKKDCTVHQQKDISCHVLKIDCKNSLIENYMNIPLEQYPEEAHDFRVEPFSIMETSYDSTKYVLNVGISWQMPPIPSTEYVKGFLLNVEDISDDYEEENFCFFFNTSQTKWNKELINTSPRFQLTSDKEFSFDKKYNISLITLPSLKYNIKKINTEIKMPTNPAHLHAMQHLSPNCTNYSHPYANKWTAGFQSITVHPNSRTIQVIFRGAPPQYCFEGYEVRLMDAANSEVVFHTKLRIEEMIIEKKGQDTIFKGIVNFTNADFGVQYTPSVLPIETASDGRCLCPVNADDPYDKTIVCSCIAAEGHPVIMERPSAPSIDCKDCYNQTIKPVKDLEFKEYLFNWLIFLPMFFVTLLLGLLAYFIIKCYQKQRENGKIVNIRFVKDNNDECSNEKDKNIVNDNCQEICKIPLIMDIKKRILIIYNHDCEQHDTTVLAFASYLKAFDFDVKLDIWDIDEISENINDYVSSSIINSDIIIVINSVGAYHRYQAKIDKEYYISRNKSSPLDSLFLSQINHSIEHGRIISARFQYTLNENIIIPLRTNLQFVLPENGPPLISNIINAKSRNDPILKLHKDKLDKISDAVKEMQNYIRKNPNWFIESHHKVPYSYESPQKLIKNDDLSQKIPISSELIPNDTGIFSATEETSLLSTNDDERIEMEVILNNKIKESKNCHYQTSSLIIDSGVNSLVICSEEQDISEKECNKKHSLPNSNNSLNYLKNECSNLTIKEPLKHLSNDSGMISDLNNSISAT
ncbi:SEFIR domain-containing protein [Strongyloides ratti]|uniref:SEFIR domain-containing protein n=1 Tax=Strongyloides ratti TaxID=34506 RepID=A0A090LNY0_STRRB|nr:SEFIR domain-containing protein [Strongyloides ratti]CEF71471.1 SEFIR domain-containing protein [Strongyloides ratti]